MHTRCRVQFSCWRDVTRKSLDRNLENTRLAYVGFCTYSYVSFVLSYVSIVLLSQRGPSFLISGQNDYDFNFIKWWLLAGPTAWLRGFFWLMFSFSRAKCQSKVQEIQCITLLGTFPTLLKPLQGRSRFQRCFQLSSSQPLSDQHSHTFHTHLSPRTVCLSFFIDYGFSLRCSECNVLSTGVHCHYHHGYGVPAEETSFAAFEQAAA